MNKKKKIKETVREKVIPLLQLLPITCSVKVPDQHCTGQNVTTAHHSMNCNAFFLSVHYSTRLFISSLFTEPLPFVSSFWHVLFSLLLDFFPNKSLTYSCKDSALSLSWCFSIQSTGFPSFCFWPTGRTDFIHMYLINCCNLTLLFFSTEL